MSRPQGGKYTPPPPCRAVPHRRGRGNTTDTHRAISTIYPPSSHCRPAWQFLHSSFCLLPSPSRVAVASRRQEEHPARRRVNLQARTPALRRRGSWSQCMRKIERRLSMNLRNIQHPTSNESKSPHLTLTLSPPIRMGAERGKQTGSIHIRKVVWRRQVQGFNARTFPGNSLPQEREQPSSGSGFAAERAAGSVTGMQRAGGEFSLSPGEFSPCRS